jgi:signal transduction histidine kinase
VLKIEAIAKTDPDKIKFFNSMVVDEKNTEFPLSILYYSIRSRQSVILKDASKKNKFTSDPYFMESKPFSILCKPLIKKNTVIGILYLENNLLNGAFSEGNLNILDFFTSQILVSIENSQLYEALVREIENKDKAVIEIKAKQELLQNVSAELVSAEERERKTIAEDLHDSVSQSLAFSISRLKSLDLSDLYSTTDQLLEVLTFLTQAANNIRSLTFQLSPPLLRDLGFEDSLEWLCEDFFTRYDLKILFKNGLQESVCLDETVKLILYRAVRELAMNIVKHARVKSAELNLFLENNYFVVVLEDKGAGFDVQSSLEKSQRFGLFSIYKRMEAINGSIEIFSEKTKGTKVIIKIAAFS